LLLFAQNAAAADSKGGGGASPPPNGLEFFPVAYFAVYRTKRV